MAVTLITGPTRSGKSEFAERLAGQSGRLVVYVATARLAPEDAEWQTRIEVHRRRRPSGWQLIETAQNISLSTVIGAARADQCLLVDSLGTWLAEQLTSSPLPVDSSTELLKALTATAADVIVVSEETGWGVVPAYPLGRQFRDELGRLNRRIARQAAAAYLVVSGYALDLKRLGVEIDC